MAGDGTDTVAAATSPHTATAECNNDGASTSCGNKDNDMTSAVATGSHVLPPPPPPPPPPPSAAVPVTTTAAAAAAAARAATGVQVASTTAALTTPAATIAREDDDVDADRCTPAQSGGDDDGEDVTGAAMRCVSTELGEMNEIESMCPRCEQTGLTRLMITRIPHFKEVIVSSFECAHCGERNNEVTFGGVFGPKRVIYELHVCNKRDLDRQVVKSEYATVTIPELQLEIPPESQRGVLNTVEGMLEQTRAGLELQQPLRKAHHAELYEQIRVFCEKLETYKSGTVPFTLIVDDPAGNSYVEAYYSPDRPTVDAQLHKVEVERTALERQQLGLALEYNTERTADEEQHVDDGHLDDISRFPCDCPACGCAGHMLMHRCDIPHFKETVIMAFRCDACGYKNNEIKSGGAIAARALRLTLRVESEADLKRDVLKSETATLCIPEVALELAPGTLGGFFSTVEGTLVQIRDQLRSLPQVDFATGDTADASARSLLDVVRDLDALLALERPFTFILDDPLANVYIQNPHAHLPPPDDVDGRLHHEEYTRTAEQDEELGIDQMHTDDTNACAASGGAS